MNCVLGSFYAFTWECCGGNILSISCLSKTFTLTLIGLFFSFFFFLTYIPADTLVISMVTQSELGIFVMERIAAR